MYKNYFFLNRLVTELNKEFSGYDIIRAFSFEKDRLILILSDSDKEAAAEISVNPGLPYFSVKGKISVPKKNLADFFNHYLPLKINTFGIAANDRIVKINCGSINIYFAIRGKYSNIYLIDDDSDIISFKKTEIEIADDFKNEIKKTVFISHFNNLQDEHIPDEPLAAKKKYPILGKDIINETINRSEKKGDSFSLILKVVLNEIRDNNPAVFIDEQTGEVNLGVESFSVFPFTRKTLADNVNDALNIFLAEKFKREITAEKKKRIGKFLDRELTKISRKLNDVLIQIERGSREEEFNKSANLLLVNINSIKKGYNKIELTDIYNKNLPVIIKLDPKLSPEQNVNAYFNKARNEKVRLLKSKQLYDELSVKFLELQKINAGFLAAETSEELNNIMKQLKLDGNKKVSQPDDLKNKFKHYIIQNKYNVYVGKDSRNNDLLTMKFAKPNDFWFHARSVSGSHVVLKNESPKKEGIPKNILKITASLAAFHSKAKTSGMAPVSYTQKKYVSKKKGMEPGKVALTKEEVLIVKPEIPKECEYVS